MMELLITLRDIKNIELFKDKCDGYLVGSDFSTGFDYTLEDIQKINTYCLKNNKKLYIVLDSFIEEDELDILDNYLFELSKLNISGIYFHDLGVYTKANKYNLKDKLIYDGKTVLCNSKEVKYYLDKNINGVVISRELTLSEVKTILNNNPNKVDMQIFGHLRLSYSKRKFLTNYFKQINKDYDYINKKSLYLIEELRDYKMPIIEDKNSTQIYSDYVFLIYKEFNELKDYINRAIIDTLFLDEERIVNVLDDYNNLNQNNYEELLNRLNNEYPNTYSTGYFYEKTNITKDE